KRSARKRTSTTSTSTAPKCRLTTRRLPTGNAGDISNAYETQGQGCPDYRRRQRHRPASRPALLQGRRRRGLRRRERKGRAGNVLLHQEFDRGARRRLESGGLR